MEDFNKTHYPSAPVYTHLDGGNIEVKTHSNISKWGNSTKRMEPRVWDSLVETMQPYETAS